MKVRIKRIIILMIMIICIFIFLLMLKYFRYSNYSSLTLAEIKNKILSTEEIHVCRLSKNLKNSCRKSSLIKIVDNKEIIKEFVEITNKLGEKNPNDSSILIKDMYTIYFIDGKGKVIVSADFGWHYVIKTKEKNYHLSGESVMRLRELLDFDSWCE